MVRQGRLAAAQGLPPRSGRAERLRARLRRDQGSALLPQAPQGRRGLLHQGHTEAVGAGRAGLQDLQGEGPHLEGARHARQDQQRALHGSQQGEQGTREVRLGMSEQQKQPDKEAAERKMMRDAALRMALTSDARQRLANVKMVRPDLAGSIEEYVIQLASSGKLRKPVDDEQVKQMLGALQEKKREIKIRRI
ncbi:MAG: DNA-binding protein [Nitrososphaerota archaeon]|nr:DNA-binding protein [Nitrososphaerota archaeon]MDG6919178.1 DNA-binding protein [Nitrososphaerota archaeon]MDG6920582.1 DNA-binding protein [Nitrososphaerota archaeon]MDG6924855.1 DNA-binding protein [Nitrososphaerota archaeon]MDG6937588.1 DNA-binding protein [Nitrososphaerota archaeon]